MNTYKHIIEGLGGEFVYSASEKRVNTTETDLSELEVKLGAPLPPEYREFLADFGGYAFADVYFPLNDEISVDVDVFYGVKIGLTLDSFHNWSINLVNGVIPDYLLPIANNGSRSLFLIDISIGNSGRIYLLPEEKSTSPYYVNHFILLSESFDSFLNHLQRIPEV